MLLANTDNGGNLRHNMKKMWKRMRLIVNRNRGFCAKNRFGQTEGKRTRNQRMVDIEREMEALAQNIIFTNKNIHRNARVAAQEKLKEVENAYEFLSQVPPTNDGDQQIAGIRSKFNAKREALGFRLNPSGASWGIK
eukprot:5776013-Prymnesium_polylepis.1